MTKLSDRGTIGDRWGFKRAVRDSLDAFVDDVVLKYRPEKVILFGSYAWGTPGEESDVDLLVVKDTDDVWDLTRKIGGWEMHRGFPLDVLVYTPERVRQRVRLDDPFLRKILRDGKVLYEQ